MFPVEPAERSTRTTHHRVPIQAQGFENMADAWAKGAAFWTSLVDFYFFNFEFKSVFWYLVCVVILPFFAVAGMVRVAYVVDERQAAKTEYPYPHYGDLWITSLALLIMLPSRMLLARFVFQPLGNVVLPTCKERPRWTPSIRANRLDRFGHVCFKFVYFLSVTVFGFWVLKDAPFLPSALGGSGEVWRAFDDFPYSPQVPYLKEYYLIQLAYHVHSLVFHVFLTEHRNDFLEMLLHHGCAIYLVVFSYFHNFLRLGSLVLLLHDAGQVILLIVFAADVVGYLIKCTVDTKYTKLTLSVYASLLVSWAYTRFYVFPVVVLGGVYVGMEKVADSDPEAYHPWDWTYFIYMLWLLIFLHVYWYGLFLYMGYFYAKTGSTQDLQNKVGGEDGEAEEREVQRFQAKKGT